MPFAIQRIFQVFLVALPWDALLNSGEVLESTDERWSQLYTLRYVRVALSCFKLPSSRRGTQLRNSV